MRRIIVFLSFFAAGPCAAEQVRLAGEALKSTVSGSVVELDTPIGTTVSIRFSQDGMMSGDARELAAVLGAATDRGRWWLENSQLCYKWFRWFDAEPRCLVISQEAKRIFWQRDDGENGTGTIVEQGKPSEKPAAPVSVVAKASTVDLSGQVSGPIKSPKAPAEEALGLQTDHIAQIAPSTSKTATAKGDPGSLIDISAVPKPHLAVRPKRLVAVASLKPVPRLPLAPAVRSFRVAGVDPTDVLSIRTGPSQDSDAIGGIPPNSHGIVITGPCRDDWCPVKHRRLAGWVNRYYLAEDVAVPAQDSER